jgi:hypothetical protein
MKDTYELWNTESSNLIGTYPTERAALRVVYDAIQRLGEGSVTVVALGREDESGRLVPVAQGAELVKLACRGREPGPIAKARKFVNRERRPNLTPITVSRAKRVVSLRLHRRHSV